MSFLVGEKPGSFCRARTVQNGYKSSTSYGLCLQIGLRFSCSMEQHLAFSIKMNVIGSCKFNRCHGSAILDSMLINESVLWRQPFCHWKLDFLDNIPLSFVQLKRRFWQNGLLCPPDMVKYGSRACV